MIGPDPKPKKRVKIEIDKHAFRDEHDELDFSKFLHTPNLRKTQNLAGLKRNQHSSLATAALERIGGTLSRVLSTEDNRSTKSPSLRSPGGEQLVLPPDLSSGPRRFRLFPATVQQSQSAGKR